MWRQLEIIVPLCAEESPTTEFERDGRTRATECSDLASITLLAIKGVFRLAILARLC